MSIIRARQQEGEPTRTYIVVLAPEVDAAAVAAEHAATSGIEVVRTFSSALNGYAARIDPRRLPELRADPRVLAIEEDQPMRALP